MTKKSLLDVVFSSEKRKNMLVLLHDGPKGMEAILKSLNTTRQALLPQVRILEDHYLVAHYEDTYELTTIGKLAIDEMLPLLNTSEFFDVDVDYWGTHNLDCIPPFLLDTMSEMKNCEIINPPFEDLYDMHTKFHKQKGTETIYKVTNFLYPDYNTIFNEMINSGATINYIVSEDLLDKIRKDHRENFKAFIETNMFKLYVYKEKIDFLFFTFDDFHILIGLFKRDGFFDNKYILCSGTESVQWGKDFFDYFLKDSTPINEL